MTNGSLTFIVLEENVKLLMQFLAIFFITAIFLMQLLRYFCTKNRTDEIESPKTHNTDIYGMLSKIVGMKFAVVKLT